MQAVKTKKSKHKIPVSQDHSEELMNQVSLDVNRSGRQSIVDAQDESNRQLDAPAPKKEKSDGGSAFLRAARNGNYEKVLEHLRTGKADIHTSNTNGLNALHLSAKEGYVNIVSELLTRGANVNAASKKGNTALHISSLAGQTEVVKLLVENGAKVNIQSQSGFTPLYMAAQENYHEIVKYLLDSGANPNIATEDGFTPMAVALQQGHSDVVNVLMENSNKGRVRLSPLHVAAKKDDVKAATLLLENDVSGAIVNEPTKSGFTPLHIAAHYGNLNVATLLISHGANVDFKARNSISPLHVASKWGRRNVVQLLLDNGATIDCKTRDGLTPLHCAARSGHDLVIDLLLERKAPVSSKTRNGLTALHMAAQGDHVDCARILIYHGAPVDDVTVDYLTPLHVAAHCGNVTSAKLLLDRNCEVNARALNGFTPLHIACKKNRIKVIELLLQYGAFIGSTTESGLTPLHVAAFMGYNDIVALLLNAGCDPNASTTRGETALHLATRSNQIDTMRLLLRNGAQVDAQAKEGQTPLHIASRNGSVEGVTLLLKHKANKDAATKELYTPLHIAAKEGHEEISQILMDNGADPTIKTLKGFSPLHIAAKYGNVGVAETLIKKGAKPDIEGKNGLTPLHVATHYNQAGMAQLLLEKGASPHCSAKNGYTPLHIAAKKDEIDIATALLHYKAKPDAESRNGFTPLHLASQEGNADMVALLLSKRANVNCRAKNGLTPMHLAAQEDHVPVAEILVKYHAEIDPQTKAGYTPLHTACHFGMINMIRFLLEHGASVSATTKAGYTPLHQAAQQGHVLVINLLLRYKADPNALTATGQTPLSIAQRLGFISVVEILKQITEVTAVTVSDEKYKVMSPEMMQEAAMSDEEEDDEPGEAHLADQSYQYLTTGDDMKGLQGDSSPTIRTKDRESYERASDRYSDVSSLPRGGPTEDEMIHTHEYDVDEEQLLGTAAAAGTGAIAAGAVLSARNKQKEDAGDDVDLKPTRRPKASDKYDASTTNQNVSPDQLDNEPIAVASVAKGGEKKKKKKKKDKHVIDTNVLETDLDKDINGNGIMEETGISGQDDGGSLIKPETQELLLHEALEVNGEPPLDSRANSRPREGSAGAVSADFIRSPERRYELSATPDHLRGSADYKFDSSVATTPDYTKSTEYRYDNVPATAADNLSVPGTTGMPGYKSNMSETDSRMFGSTYSGVSYSSSFDPDNVTLSRQPVYSGFLVSFMVDARGGAMRGCRHSGIRIIIPPGRASMPTRVTCKLVRREKLPLKPPLMEGEALASRVLVMGPAGAKFLGPVILEVPHFASVRGLEREIIVLRSDDGQTWKEHSDLATVDNIQKTLCGSFEGDGDLESAEDLYHRRITRIVTGDFPKYFALVTRIRQDVGLIGPDGGRLSTTVEPKVQAVFPSGALTKAIKVGLQAQCLSDDLVVKTVGENVGVSPIVTIEPRRRKFHKPITVTIPLPAALHGKQPGDRLPTLRLLCSITGANAATDWEDITGSTPLTLLDDCITFTTNVSARFWLIHCKSYKESVRLGTEIFSEAIAVPFMANFVIFARRRGDATDGQLRLFCMTDDKMDKTLETQEKFIEIAKSRDVEVLDGYPQFVECGGNLLPIPKSDKDKQPYINFRAFKENRQSINVKLRDVRHDPSGFLAFMAEPREVPGQTPICTLNITLPSAGKALENGGAEVAHNAAELHAKLDALQGIDVPEDESISKAELRLTDIAEYLDDDWILLARQLNISRQEIIKIQQEYGYVTEQALVMLHLWIEKNKEEATGNALERALNTIGRQDIIQRCIYTLKEVTDVSERQVALEHLERDEKQDVENDVTDRTVNGHRPDNGVTEEQLESSLARHRTESGVLQDNLDNLSGHDVEEIEGDESGEFSSLRVYTDTLEGEPEVETDVQNFEEVLPDGTVVRRRVTKTRQKQMIVKRVVMEGPEDELPTNEQEAQDMLRDADYPLDEDSSRPGSVAAGAEAITAIGEPSTNVQEFEETLDDGTVVKRRIVTTTQQQLKTERVVLEGDVSFDDDDYDDDDGAYDGEDYAGDDDYIPRQQAEGVFADGGSDDEGGARLVLKKEIRKQKVLIDGKEETIVSEDVQLIQDLEEPEELRDSVQSVVNQFIQGGSV